MQQMAYKYMKILTSLILISTKLTGSEKQREKCLYSAFGLNVERYSISPYSVRKRQNTDQKNFEYAKFSRIVSKCRTQSSIFLLKLDHRILINAYFLNELKLGDVTTISKGKDRHWAKT